MKAKLRKEILEKRKQLISAETAEWDKKILENLKGLFSLEANSTSGSLTGLPEMVYCYISVRGETGTDLLIDWLLQQGVRVAVPRVSGKEMAFFYINNDSDLIPGTFGIPEPAPHLTPAVEKCAPVIVPGVAFSTEFGRIGYGAGYYDRFFEKEPEHMKIAICYEFQLFEHAEAEAHDVPMDWIITPERILRRQT